MREQAKKWMQEEKQQYLDQCESAAEAVDYLAGDCNSEAGVDLSEEVRFEIAREVLAQELEAEGEDDPDDDFEYDGEDDPDLEFEDEDDEDEFEDEDFEDE